MMRAITALAALVMLSACIFSASASGGPVVWAPEGEVTRAIASSDWTTGSIAGWVRNDCGPGCDYWVAVAALGPGGSECPLGFLGGEEPDVREFWSSGAEPNGATASFDFAEMPILPGLVGQQVCLYAVEPYRSEETATFGHVAIRPMALAQPPSAVSPASVPQTSTPPVSSCSGEPAGIVRLRSQLRKARRAGHHKAVVRIRKALEAALAGQAARC